MYRSDMSTASAEELTPEDIVTPRTFLGRFTALFGGTHPASNTRMKPRSSTVVQGPDGCLVCNEFDSKIKTRSNPVLAESATKGKAGHLRAVKTSRIACVSHRAASHETLQAVVAEAVGLLGGGGLSIGMDAMSCW